MPPKAAPNQLLDVLVPLAGLDLSVPYTNQTRATPISDQQVTSKSQLATTPIAVNVRGFDASQGRRRLSRRMGQIKYATNQLNGDAAFQEINALVGTGYISGGLVFIPGSATAGTVMVGITGDPDGLFAIYSGGNLIGKFGDPATETYNGGATDGSNFYVYSTASAGPFGLKGMIRKYAATGHVLWSRTLWTAPGTADAPAGLGYAPAPTVIGTNLYFNVQAVGGSDSGPIDVSGLYRIKTSDGTDTTTNPWVTGAALDTAGSGGDAWYTDGMPTSPVTGNGFIALPLANGVLPFNDINLVFVKVSDGSLTARTGFLASQGLTTSLPTYVDTVTTDGTNFYMSYRYAPTAGVPAQHGILGAGKFNSAGTVAWNRGTLATSQQTATPSSAYQSDLPAVYVGGHDFAISLDPATGATLDIPGTPLGNTTDFKTTSSGAYAATTADSVFYGTGPTPDWTITGISPIGFLAVFDPGTDGGATLGTTGTITNYNRVLSVVGVAGGTVKVMYNKTWQPTINGDTALNPTTAVIRSAPNIGNLYFADGTNWKYYNPTDNTVHAWVASAGQLPVDSGGYLPRLICLWRSRTVLSGLPRDPNNYFMSAVGDPTNFNYNPVPTLETQAVAGNNSPAGIVGDIVTALIPYNDDVLIFGGDHTIYQMTGDPAAGGRIDLISDITGMAWGTAWCKTPNGTLYFFSSRGSVYTMAPGSIPMRVSQAIDQNLSQLDLSACVIRFTYDERWQGVNLWITPYSGGATLHYYYDEATGAWWSDQYGNNLLNPFAVFFLDGDVVTDRVSLMGGQDGWVRSFSPTSLDDDGGTVIASEVLCGPVMFKSGYDVMMIDLQGDLAVTGGSVSWAIQTGYSVQNAVNNPPLFTGLFGPDRNRSQQVRSSGVAIYVALSRAVSELPWSVESLRGVIRPLQIIRQRQF